MSGAEYAQNCLAVLSYNCAGRTLARCRGGKPQPKRTHHEAHEEHEETLFAHRGMRGGQSMRRTASQCSAATLAGRVHRVVH